jgi:hypothetical protein
MGHHRRTTRMAIALAAASLLAVGCGSDLADQIQDFADTAQQAAEEATDEAAVADASDAADATDDTDTTAEPAVATEAVDLSALVAQAPTATVYQRGFEFTVTNLQVIDLDQQHAEETGSEVDDRVRGFEFVADLDVFNATSSAGAPGRTAVSLQWTEPGSENVISLRGQLEVREAPSLASTSGQVTIPISVADAELFDADTSALIFGEIGRSAAVLPLGNQPELVTRLPVELPELDDLVIDLGALEVIITRGMIFYETGSDGPLADGDALLELTYDIDSTGFDVQTCSTRGTGAWALTLPDGTGIVEIGVSERCVTRGQVERGVLTGFFIDADYAGPYTIAHERSGGGEDYQGEATFTLEEREGSTHAERNP